MEHMDQTYNDVLSMPTIERRYFLGLIVRRKHLQSEKEEEGKQVSGGKGTRKKTIGGNALKTALKTGQIPNTK